MGAANKRPAGRRTAPGGVRSHPTIGSTPTTRKRAFTTADLVACVIVAIWLAILLLAPSS